MTNIAPTISVRKATLADLTYIDSLQRKFSREVGFWPKQALEGYIQKHVVTIALINGSPAAYLLGRDTCEFEPTQARVYQTAVQMDTRHLAVGRALVEAYCSQLPDSAHTVALFCAQDIEANLFWEALGFTAIGFRDGSRQKGRLHILWERTTRPEDDPLFPAVPDETSGGMMREKRIITPLKPGQNWRDVRSKTITVEKRVGKRLSKRAHQKQQPIFVVPPGKIRILVGGRLKYRDKIVPLA